MLLPSAFKMFNTYKDINTTKSDFLKLDFDIVFPNYIYTKKFNSKKGSVKEFV